MKTVRLFCIVGFAVSLLVSCADVSHPELTREEAHRILEGIVAGQAVLEEAAMRYFSNLSSENNNILRSDVVYSRIQAGEEIWVLDIRRSQDFAQGHIAGATNVWWFDVGNNLHLLPENVPVVVACYTGQSSGQVVVILQLLGYQAFSLLGGMNNGWLPAGLPVVGTM